MTYLSFAKATAERAVKTFAQALVALLIADGTDLLGTAWADRLSVAGMAAVLSVLSSIASAPFGQTGPSASNEAIVPPAVDPAAPAPDTGHADLATVIVSAAVAVLVVALYVVLI